MRKPVLLIDNSEESLEAIRLLDLSKYQYVKYHIQKFEESCCGELPTTKAPSILAPEGVFKGLDGVKEYLATDKNADTDESAYW